MIHDVASCFPSWSLRNQTENQLCGMLRMFRRHRIPFLSPWGSDTELHRIHSMPRYMCVNLLFLQRRALIFLFISSDIYFISMAIITLWSLALFFLTVLSMCYCCCWWWFHALWLFSFNWNSRHFHAWKKKLTNLFIIEFLWIDFLLSRWFLTL